MSTHIPVDCCLYPPPPPPPRDNASPYICRYRLHAAHLRPIINALSLYCAGNKPTPRNALFNQNSNISRQLSSRSCSHASCPHAAVLTQLFSRSCPHASCPHASCPHSAVLMQAVLMQLFSRQLSLRQFSSRQLSSRQLNAYICFFLCGQVFVPNISMKRYI
jgi:hypothetical protein